MTYPKSLSGADRMRRHGNACGATVERPGPIGTDRHTGEHWLAPELIYRSALSSPVELSPYVIDIEGEIRFWHLHYKRSGIRHRNILPFGDYEAAFKLGISLFLQCHSHALEALNEAVLASTYERVRRASRVEWTEARHAVHAAFERLQSRWNDTVQLRKRQEAGAPEAARAAGDIRDLHPPGRTSRAVDRSARP